MNYLVFDDNFTFVNTGFKELALTSSYTRLAIDHIRLQGSGYLIAYVSYESANANRAYFDDFKVTHKLSSVVQVDDYYPFGLTFNSYTSGNENLYKYNGMEEQKETGWYQPAEFRMYDPALGRFNMIDPVIKFHESPYAWNTNNPISFNDPMGSDSTQRANAVAKAQEFIDEKPEGNSYEMSKKGDPGENVDCSGLASKCVEAGGESDPNKAVAGGQRKADGSQSGVLNIEDNTTKVGTGSAQSGNLVTFHKSTGYPYHTGVVKRITKNADGTYSVTFIHSKSGTGPTENSFTTGDGSSWANSLHGFYKWDTKPDAAVSTSSNVPGGTATSIGPGRSPSVVDRMINSGVPILRDLGKIINGF